MKNKILKIGLILIILLIILFSINLISNATVELENGVIIDDDIIYRILPKTTVTDLENMLGITFEKNAYVGSSFNFVGDDLIPYTDMDDPVDPITSFTYTLYNGNQLVTSGYIKTGMEIIKGGSVAGYSQVLSVIGDINQDGDCNAIDLTRIIRHIIGKSGGISSAAQLKSADINNDGTVSVGDLTKSIKYIVTQNENHLTGKVNTTEPKNYQLTLDLKYYVGMNGNLNGQSDENAYINSTNVIIDGNKYDLTNAEVSNFQISNFGEEVKEYEKVYTITVKEGSLIAITTNNTSDTTWNFNNSKISESEYVYLQMPNRNATLNIANKMTTSVDNLQHGSATIDNSVREMTGNISNNLTGVKELDLTITKYGGLRTFTNGNLDGGTSITDLYPSTSNDEIANSTVVRINGIKYDLTNASVNDISIPEEKTPISYTKTYKIFVKPGDEVVITTNNSDDTTWKYNGTTVKNGIYASFNMPDSNVDLSISNDYSLVSTGIGLNKEIVIDDSVRLINGTTGLSIK